MNQHLRRQQPLIDATGLGFLPGIALAFLATLLAMAALLVPAWWVVGSVLALVLCATGAVVWVIWGFSADDDEPEDRPGHA